jgi:hypothetical protein
MTVLFDHRLAITLAAESFASGGASTGSVAKKILPLGEQDLLLL